MGKMNPTAQDDAQSLVTGSLTATGSSAAFVMDANKNWGAALNAVLWGTFVGTMQLQRSFDGGTTWVPACTDQVGTAANYTAPAAVVFQECERTVLWRWTCTAFTSGTINYRLSR
jgi:hypothetical protein